MHSPPKGSRTALAAVVFSIFSASALPPLGSERLATLEEYSSNLSDSRTPSAPPICKTQAGAFDQLPTIVITVRDFDDGLATGGIDTIIRDTDNFMVTIPDFTPGTRQPVEVRATLIDTARVGSVELKITDVAGLQKRCELDHFPDSPAMVTILDPTGNTTRVQAIGPTTVLVDLSSLDDTDSDTKQQVKTQIVHLDLTDGFIILRLRPVTSHPFKRSTGEIEENFPFDSDSLDVPPFGPPGSTASSFFDIFFEIEIPSLGLVLHNHMPSRQETPEITHKPPLPMTVYRKPVKGIPLFTESETFSGFFLLTAAHAPAGCGGGRLARVSDHLFGCLK